MRESIHEISQQVRAYNQAQQSCTAGRAYDQGPMAAVRRPCSHIAAIRAAQRIVLRITEGVDRRLVADEVDTFVDTREAIAGPWAIDLHFADACAVSYPINGSS